MYLFTTNKETILLTFLKIKKDALKSVIILKQV